MPRIATTAALLALAACAGPVAQAAGLPLPWLLGPMIVTAALVIGMPRAVPRGYRFPQALRMGFLAIIGLMIGAQVTPALFTGAEGLALSLAALTLFVGLAHGLGYAVFRHLGGYDPTTALYASTPGGLYESIAMGEAAGADMPRLMLQQFLRVIVVVTFLPVALSLWTGAPVGSSAGQSLARAGLPWTDLPVLALAVAAGLAAGHLLRLPAGQMTGPMAVAAALSLSGLLSLDVPQWLVNLAQVVVGAALGMRFCGVGRGLILRGLGLSLVSVALMLGLGLGFALLLHRLLDEPVDVLLISFAPGGVTEMALVALSLQANPAFVTLHHVYRIVLTVMGLGLITRLRRR